MDLDIKPSIRPDAGVIEKRVVGKRVVEIEFMGGVCRQDVNGFDSDADDEHEEGVKAKGVTNAYLPSQFEIEEHEFVQLPFRVWCPHCVQGKRVSAAHKKRNQQETQVPVILCYIDWLNGAYKERPRRGREPNYSVNR